ncbi:unnamed protein product [Allacma fusca]|uniref:Protein kinase domain-containing protein n=1 Tax=Allacma fusca TaxID=39272 RepID=A0A8J2K9N6_9HEXA|nr:unnamed protein product [Allacma fusca]
MKKSLQSFLNSVRFMTCPVAFQDPFCQFAEFEGQVFEDRSWLYTNNIGQAKAGPAILSSPGSRSGLSEWVISSTEVASSSEAVFISFGFLISLVMFAILCTAGCCQNIFGKRQKRDDQTTDLSSPNPELASTSGIQSSEDAQAIEMGDIEFEPLPRLQDLTPISCYSDGGCQSNSSVSRSFGTESPHKQRIDSGSADVTAICNYTFNTNKPLPEFPRNQIEHLKEVGTGWFGKVMESEADEIVPSAKNLRVVVKILREDATLSEQMRFLEECHLYSESSHRNILKLLGCSTEQLPFLLILEHCDHGDLKSFLTAIATASTIELVVSQDELLRMGHDIAQGLEWMSSADFIHKDLAARNCQIADDGRVVIGDYGLSFQNFRDEYYWGSNVPIPLRWSAPETLKCTISTIQTQKVLKSSNVWTFGVVLWEIFEFGKLPYSQLSDDDVILRVVTDCNSTLPKISRPDTIFKDELDEIMLSCWNPQPDLRPTISAIAERISTLCSSRAHGKVSENVHSKLSASCTTYDEFDRRWNDFGDKIQSPQVQDKTPETNWGKNQCNVLNLENNNYLPKTKPKKSVSFASMLSDEFSEEPVKSKLSPVKREIPSVSFASMLTDEISGEQVKSILSPVKRFEIPLPYLKLSETPNGQCTTPENSLMSGLMNSSSDLTTGTPSATSLSSSSGEIILNAKTSWNVNRNLSDDRWLKQTDLLEVSQRFEEKSPISQNLFVNFEPSELSDNLVLSRSQAQGAEQSTTETPTTSGFTGTGTSDSSPSQTTILRNTCIDNTVVQIHHSIPEGTVSSNSDDNEDFGENTSQWLPLSANETTHGYSADISSVSRNEPPRKSQALDASLKNDWTSSLFSSNPLFETSPSSSSHSIDTEQANADNPIVTSSIGTPLPPSNIASQNKFSSPFFGAQSDARTPQNLPVISVLSPGLPDTTLTGSISCHSAPAGLYGPSAIINVVDGLEPRSLRKVQKNFRNLKTSTPNFSPESDVTSCSDSSSFFRKDDDVFEDFTMEFNDPVSPIGKMSASTHLQITDCTGGKYRGSKVLGGSNLAHLYQGQTMELASESTSTGGSDSNDYFDSFISGTRQPQNLLEMQGMDEVPEQTKSGFQDIFGRKISLNTPQPFISQSSAISHITGTDSSISLRVPVARKLEFESAQSNETSTEGSNTVVSAGIKTSGTSSSIYSNTATRNGRQGQLGPGEGVESVQGVAATFAAETGSSRTDCCPSVVIPGAHMGQQIDSSTDCQASTSGLDNSRSKTESMLSAERRIDGN